jgi:hypothetical protein
MDTFRINDSRVTASASLLSFTPFNGEGRAEDGKWQRLTEQSWIAGDDGISNYTHPMARKSSSAAGCNV